MDIAAWEHLVAWVEAIADTRLAQVALGELLAAGGDAARAGWVDWQSAQADWLQDDSAGG